MHVLYITDYFNTPEEGGLLRTWEISQYLKKKGCEVTVICSSAHHMTGETIGKNGLLNKKNIEGVDVIKTHSFTKYRNSTLKRIIYYIFFPILAFFGALTVKRPDIIITSSPPLFLLPLGFLLCKLKRRKFIVEVRDAWLEFAIARGLVPDRLIKPLKALQYFLFKKADKIIAVTPRIKKIVDRYTKDSSRSILLMNGFEDGIDRACNHLEEDIIKLKREYDIEDKFVVTYTGTLGLARDYEIFGKTALLLKSYEDILFLFVGEGEKKVELVKYCQENALENCKFLPLQPRYKIPLFLKASHVALNSIRKNDALESSLSNKIFDYLGNGVPVIFSGKGDTADFLEESGGGVAVEAENAEEMKQAILKFYNSEKFREETARQGQRYVLDNYTRSKILTRLDDVLKGTPGK